MTVVPPKESILKAIDLVLAACNESQERTPDVVVGNEITALIQIRSYVESQWPLSQIVKSKVNIGPVAAKNLSDWNLKLAKLLMTLDYVLQNDGESLQKLLEQPRPS